MNVAIMPMLTRSLSANQPPRLASNITKKLPITPVRGIRSNAYEFAYIAALYTASFFLLKVSIAESFRRKALMTLKPEMVSSAIALRSPSSFCNSLNPLRVYFATKLLKKYIIGMTMRLVSASQWLRTNILTRMPDIVITPATSEMIFCDTAWLMASMSFVSLLMSPPAGFVSKKRIGSHWICTNKSRRRFLRAFWDMIAIFRFAIKLKLLLRK